MAHESIRRVARCIEPRCPSIDVLGRVIKVLALPDEATAAPCVMRWTIPPGIVIPLHSQPDPETLVVVSGNTEGLSQTAEGYQWTRLAPGDVFHVPGRAKQAFRNHWPEPAVMIVVATSHLGRFLLEVGKPALPTLRPANSPTPEAVRGFLETAARYGHWTATPEQNYQVGIDLPPTWSPPR
ncbi:MAG TPA: cupin domain-containing protein [Dongiaceae bacterium]|nr:cupin domain-containing protein [Dongiaceae bacterium]